MAELLKKIKRFWLRQRIEWLRADIAVATERQHYARITVESTEKYLGEAWRRLRALQSNLALIERPETLLAEALRHGE